MDIVAINSLKRDWTPQDYYSFDDLNRVELISLSLRNRINDYRGNYINLVGVIIDRTQSTIEFAESLNRIESNLTLLKNSFPEPTRFQDSKTWNYNMPFDFSDANRFEQSLYDMYMNLELNLSTIPYCGQYTAGQGVL
jgi:hypothetical protein